MLGAKAGVEVDFREEVGAFSFPPNEEGDEENEEDEDSPSDEDAAEEDVFFVCPDVFLIAFLPDFDLPAVDDFREVFGEGNHFGEPEGSDAHVVLWGPVLGGEVAEFGEFLLPGVLPELGEGITAGDEDKGADLVGVGKDDAPVLGAPGLSEGAGKVFVTGAEGRWGDDEEDLGFVIDGVAFEDGGDGVGLLDGEEFFGVVNEAGGARGEIVSRCGAEEGKDEDEEEGSGLHPLVARWASLRALFAILQDPVSSSSIRSRKVRMPVVHSRETNHWAASSRMRSRLERARKVSSW